MRAFIPVHLRLSQPPVSGEYLTDLGQLYYDTSTGRFSLEQGSPPLSRYAVGVWYKEVDVVTSEQADEAYRKGYLDGARTQISVHSFVTTN